MRRAQVYRWQIPMDAGVVLRERRLKTRDGFFVYLQQGDQHGWGEVSPLPGFSLESLDEAQAALLAWANEWRAGVDPALPDVPSAAFGISCALAELDGSLPAEATTAQRRCVPAILMNCLRCSRPCPARKWRK
jgi:O-succinylbenzoate synthase